MADPFVGEIRMFAGNFAPRGWANCDGQLLAVSQNDTLFSLFGTIYGGDGRTTFGLPDLRGRIPIHYGSGPGLTPRNLGTKAGSERVTVSSNELPSHNHGGLRASADGATEESPDGNVLAQSEADAYSSSSPSTYMNSNSTSSSGGSQSHENTMPFLCINFIVALVGIYPSR